jgi:putative OPT family oligopeptide transporter
MSAEIAESPGAEVAPYAAPDVPQFTLRALATGMLLGAVLSLCNIYTGLKIGWGTNMSITAVLLAYAVWLVPSKLFGRQPFGILENNLNQAAASAGAAISSSGLVAAIPALTMLTGKTLAWHWLVVWTFSVSAVGVVVAVAMRRQMLLVDKLPFPFGIATGETLREMYARGREAVTRVLVLLGAGVVAAVTKTVQELIELKPWGVPGAISATGVLAQKKVGMITLKNLGFAFEPSLLFLGVGALIGIRAGVSLLIGVVVGWGLLAPMALERGWAAPGKPDDIWFGPVVQWLLWPGVALMVTASLTSFALSGRSVIAALRGARGAGTDATESREEVSRRTLARALCVVLVLTVVCQIALFGIRWWVAILAMLLTFVLAIVAGRVTGETGITPVGPMGKVTQLTFGLVAPGDPTANLMAANVTGGAASQCGDLLVDLKTGTMLGAWPRFQAWSQACGVFAGALTGSAAYLLLIPDPAGMLLKPDWPAPAVAQWKAVAEVFQKGLAGIPPGALHAMTIAAAAGVAFALAAHFAPPRLKPWIPGATSVGLAMVVPAYYSIAMFVGALLAALVARVWPSWSARFVAVVASGVIAGESLAGVVFAVKKVLAG